MKLELLCPEWKIGRCICVSPLHSNSRKDITRGTKTMPSQGCGTDTPQWSYEDLSATISPSTVNDDETAEKFMNLWSSLPGTTELKNQGIDRIQRKKSSVVFDTALSDLVSATSNAEKKKQAQFKQRSDIKSARSALLLDASRFRHESYSKTAICNDVNDFLESAPRSWAAELKSIQSDLNMKLRNRADSLKPKIAKGIDGRDTKDLKTSYKNEILQKTSEMEIQALKQEISDERRKEIKSEMSDMDLWNRPLFFIKPHLDSTEETQSTVSMRDSLMKKLSQETSDYLQKSEPKFSSTGNITYNNPDELKELPKKKSPSGTSYFHTRIATPRVRQYQPAKSMSKIPRSPNRGATKPTNDTDYNKGSLDYEDMSAGSDAGQDKFDPLADDGFGLDFLKDFVSFQEESTWIRNDEEDDVDESQTVSQSN